MALPPKIPLNDLMRQTASMATEIRTAIDRTLDSGWFILGREGQCFESEFASYVGSRFAVGVANGTDALELALRAIGVGVGVRVANVANAGGYTTTALRSIGAVPSFIDVNRNNGLMNLDRLELALGHERHGAIVITHLFGQAHDMPAITKIARRHGVPVVEDCAQAHGAVIAGKRVGSFGDVACFSFYPTKNLGAIGDGGMVTTSNEQLDKIIRQLRQYGWEKKYHVALPNARNSRLDEIQAAILRCKLPRLDSWNAQRRAIAARYNEKIVNPRIQKLATVGPDFVAHLYVVLAERRDELQAHLLQRGISSDIHYPVPDHLQPCWRNDFQELSLPETEYLASKSLTLPCFAELTDTEVDATISAINSWN
jgi:dTDP-4-amino-4,6-dideoxygalactose transaminase